MENRLGMNAVILTLTSGFKNFRNSIIQGGFLYRHSDHFLAAFIPEKWICFHFLRFATPDPGITGRFAYFGKPH